jgi:lipopolysaccharide/colanic/teichoic acid biosynthesis glycosyltransferase
LAYLAVRVRLDSPGPVFYRGPRMGKGGRLFKILKFRTMYERPESYAGPRVTAQDDERITKFGRWLRDSKMNELPQFWNVLAGEMSLVGPRPEDPEIAKTWPAEVFKEVLSVRPGVTSPASVLYRDEESLLQTGQVMDTYLESILPSKLRLDQLYVRHRSFLLDLDVCFWTALVVLPLLGAAPGEDILFLGPFSRLVRRYISWFAIDTLVTLAAFGAAGVFWRLAGPLDIGWSKAFVLGVGVSLLFSLIGALLGTNRIEWSKSSAMDALDLLAPVSIATAVVLAANLLWQPRPPLPPRLLVVAAPLAYAGYVVVRYRTRLISGLAARWLRARGGAMEAQERVLIIGGGDAGQFISWIMHNQRDAAVFRVVGFVDDDLYKQGSRIQGSRVLGRREDIPNLVEKHDVGIIVFAIHNIDPVERQSILEICAATQARVMMLPDILGALRDALKMEPGLAVELAAPDWQKGPAARYSPAQVDAWLAHLDSLAAAGDVEAIRGQIQALRERLGVNTAELESQKHEGHS